MTHADFLGRTQRYFQAHPNEWLSAQSFEIVGGRQAWRSRIADCRTRFGMTIENRQQIVKAGDVTFRRSEYRYVPSEVVQP